MSQEIEIYNLVFPPFVETITIGDYCFRRIENYRDAYSKLTHTVNVFGSEFKTTKQIGDHQITAKVTVPTSEKPSSLPWGNKDFTQLDDVLFLLTIFTGRNVLRRLWKDDDVLFVIDSRPHYYGSQLRLSPDSDWLWKNSKTGETKVTTEMGDEPIFEWNKINIGFERSLNKVLTTISSEKWQKEYEGGYFLFLFRSLVQRQIIETSFILSWTIWEHVFALKNKDWLDDKAIEKMSGDQKIAFILNTYFLKKIDNTARENIQRIKNTRNRLIHFGRTKRDEDIKEMNMFIRLTEQLMAIILDLKPSNSFNSQEELDEFLNNTDKLEQK